ncbi:AMED_5909 family protein [Actinokineospora sp. 24-640]
MSTVDVRVGTGAGEIATLRQAHEVLARLRPPRSSSAAAWVAFHRLAARVYAEVGEIDRGHHHEARGYWSVRERRYADYITETGVVPESPLEVPGW